MSWDNIKNKIQKVGDQIEKGIARGEEKSEEGVKHAGSAIQDHLPPAPPLKEWIDTAVDQTKETLAEAKDSVSDVSDTLSQSIQEHAQNARIQMNKVGEQIHGGVSATHQGIQQAAQTVNTGIADTLEKVAGEKIQPLTNFIREDGIQTITGLAFTPIYVAQRGVIGYESYRAFDRGEIPLGELVVRVLSPTAHTAQIFLKDPENQEMIAAFVGKIIPEHIQNEYLTAVSEASEKVGGWIPQTPQERLRALLAYRKPPSVDQQNAHF